MGGEKHQSFTLLLRHRGSPPHGRGKGRRRCRTGDGFGITPAWAGKRGVEKTPCLWYTDHPRVGGEKHSMRLLRTSYMGSPPHGRGKGQLSVGHQIRERITPAWAGKSPSCPTHSAARRDHPRVGGEKLKSGSTAAGCPGSPPRGREKILEPSMGVGNFGSPPRWRGKAVKFRCTCGLQRITPAWAGKRLLELRRKTGVRDHPRVGGEKHLSGTTDNRPQGSPPRGRGKDVLPCGKVNSSRITPARAGKKCISA